MKNVAIQTITIDKKDFFKLWLTLIQPYLKLRNKEIEVLSKFLEYRYDISKRVSGDEEINYILFSTKIKKDIQADLDISDHVLNNIVSALRKKKYIEGTSINKKLIPNIDDNIDNFKLVYNVNFK